MSRGAGKSVVSPLVVLIAAVISSADAYKVLLLFPLPTPSHAILGQGYARELLRKGHEVTLITLFPMKDLVDNLTQIDVGSVLNVLPEFAEQMPKILEGKGLSSDDFKVGVSMVNVLTHNILHHENIRSLMHDAAQKFDLVVVEWYYNEILAGFSTIFQCPLVWSNSLNFNTGISRLVDDVTNPSYTSDLFGSNLPPFTFLERAKNLWWLLRNLYHSQSFLADTITSYEQIYTTVASQRGVTLPPYQDLIYNASLVLINSHASIDAPIKLPQNVKAIGGYHIDVPPKPLPEDLKKIMDDSRDGVIYFSMGSFMKSSIMPNEMKNALLKLFGGLKQTVLWKFENELPNRPKNVHIRNWLPQPSVLAHPNIKLFITHGGLLSTTETIHYGVPIIGVPLFGDQFRNMERTTKKGLGVSVKISHNLAEHLGLAIEEVLTNSSYAATAKRISSLYHDRPLPPAEELVYWLEYVVRTGGAPHLRSPALLLPWYQRLYVDLLAFIAAALLGLIFLVRYIILMFFRAKSQVLKNISNVKRKIN